MSATATAKRSPYARMFTLPGAKAFCAAAALARLPMSMMSLGIVLVGEVHIVSGDDFDAIFLGYPYQLRLNAALQLIGVVVGARHRGFVALQLYVVVIAEH